MAEFIVGFCILFIGLNYLKESVPDVKNNPEIFAFLQHYTNMGLGSIFLFIGLGTFLTVLVQSSSASTAITIVMFSQGWIDFPIAASMVLGENIGTTVTANIAAIVANVHAKRAARFHTIFNIFGVVWILFLFYPFIHMVDYIIAKFFTDNLSVLDLDSASRLGAGTLGIALFHSLFNIFNVILLFAFIPLIEKLVIKIQPSKLSDEAFHLQYISTGLMSTIEMSVEQAKKEINIFGQILDILCLNIIALLFEKVKNYDKLTEKIKMREEQTDQLEIEISDYLSKCAAGDISVHTSMTIRSMLRTVNEMERIGDIFYQIMINVNKMKNKGIVYPEEVQQELRKMLDVIYNSIKKMRGNLLSSNFGEKEMKDVFDLEHQINTIRDNLQSAHYKRLEEDKYSIHEGIFFLDIVNSLEKIGDHIVNINEAYADI